jgi:hypothetical protein
VLAGCGGDGGEGNGGEGNGGEGAAPTVTGTFVGEAPSVGALVAVDAEAPDPSGKREVTVYVCNAKQGPEALGAWFVGTAGDSFNLSSSPPTLEGQEAEVTGDLSQDEASGTISFSAGFSEQRLDFTIQLARFPAGVYEPTLKPSGAFAGNDLFGSGAGIEGEYSGFATGDKVVKRFVLSDGTSRKDVVRQSGARVSPGLFRVIETGSASIGRKISPSTGMFVDPYVDD